jgi:D-alanyl-D-alanine carboxypeptidase
VGWDVSRVAASGVFVFRLLVAGAIAAILSSAADARQRHRDATGKRTSAAQEEYTPPAASIVIDGGNGTVLQASSPDLRCHPASLTKIMTLYLLFERLEAGELHLGDFLTASEHASEQAPSKLDLKPGQRITVEDAIKGIVTKSANDAAVVVAESLGRSEENFSKLMTQRARELGMANTTYVNVSGLPDDGQVTTAKDQALLGRAIYERFPKYYRYFSTETFVYGGEVMRNHNHLLGAVEGVDGIKTGYTRASGFNLITSVHRDNRHIIAVILGGKTASERDAHMRKLITTYTKPANFPGVALVRPQSPVLDERRNSSSDPIQALIVKAAASSQAQQQAPMGPLTLGATPIRSPNFSKPGGEVSARWPSPSEMFEPLDSIPGTRPGTSDDAGNSERRKPDPHD